MAKDQDQPLGLKAMARMEAEVTLRRLSFSRNGDYLAALSDFTPLRLWNVGSGDVNILPRVPINTGGTDLDWSTDDEYLALCNAVGTYIVSTSLVGDDRSTPFEVKLAASGRCLRWLPGSHRIIVGLSNGAIAVADVDESTPVKKLFKIHETEVNGLTVDPISESVVSTATDGSVVRWDLSTGRLIWSIERAHVSAATIIDGVVRPRVVVSPQGDWLATAGGVSVVVSDLSSGRQRHVVEGHSAEISEIAINPTGSLVATSASDGTVRLWRTDRWQEVARLKVDHGSTQWPGLSFHPREPVLAILGTRSRSADLWRYDPSSLLSKAVASTAVEYSTAKVVLVGDSGVGKTGLSLVLQRLAWRETPSTHARIVGTIGEDDSLETASRSIREIYVWDLAGQPGYRLVHQMHLHDVSVALIVFDAHSETDPLSAPRYWNRALEQARARTADKSPPLSKFIVLARADRGGVSLSPVRLKEVSKELGCLAFHRTSAKEGWGIDELRRDIIGAIQWDQVPKISSNALFLGVQMFLRKANDSGRLLPSSADLFNEYILSAPHSESGLTSAEARPIFDTCLRLLEGQGVLIRFRFGGLVLLKPELLDAYAAAAVNAARDEPDGLGSLSEESAREGRFEMASDFRVADPEQERLLLIATVEHLLHHEVVFREAADDGVQLVFPAQLTRENPALPDPEFPAGRFFFAGPVQNIYATLIVRLSHSTLFGKPELWRDAAVFRSAVSGYCGIQLRSFGEGTGEICLFHDGHPIGDGLAQLRAYIRAHLDRRATPLSVEERTSYLCAKCLTAVSDTVLRKRRERGYDWIDCPVCGERVDVSGSQSLSSAAASDMVAAIDEGARAERLRAQSLQVVAGKRKLGEYDVFMCHNSADKAAVRKIADALAEREILPWLDETDLVPGTVWVNELQSMLDAVKSVAVFVGGSGVGPWQESEINGALISVARSGRSVIPVVLPNAPVDVQFPMFLQARHYVDFRRTDPDPIDQLEWGITGRRPEPGRREGGVR